MASLPLFAGWVGARWEVWQLIGLAAGLCCIVAGGAPLRPRSALPPVLIALRTHARLGWIALVGTAAHACGLLWADPTIREYARSSMPLYMWAGWAAGGLVLIVVLSSLSRVRRRLFHSHRVFQATHVILAALLVGCLVAHIVGTARYTGGRWREAGMLAASIGALLMLLRYRRQIPTSAFGRHSVAVGVALILMSAALLTVWNPGVATALREPLRPRSAGLGLEFPHIQHAQVSCVTCHHNFTDGRGFDNCVLCHKSDRADLHVGAEARFHEFCLNCHRRPAMALVGRGPVGGCVECHPRSAETIGNLTPTSDAIDLAQQEPHR